MSLRPTRGQTLLARVRRGWQRLTWPVWNHETHRLRAPLRAILPALLTFVALGILQTVIGPRFKHPVAEIVQMIGWVLVLAGGVFVTARVIDRRPIAEYGLSVDSEWGRSFAVGGLVGLVVNAGTLVVALAAGWVTISGFTSGSGALPFVPAFLVAFGLTALAAMWEEFIFRGTILKNLAEGGSKYLPQWATVGLAFVISSLIFAAVHSGKIVHISQAGYYLVAGLVFGSVYILSGDLALPMGFHIFYNFTMAAVFGLGVSQQTPELIVVDVVGPTVWIGEEGVARVIFALVGGVLLLVYVRWRDGHLRIHDRIPQWTPRTNRDALDETSVTAGSDSR